MIKFEMEYTHSVIAHTCKKAVLSNIEFVDLLYISNEPPHL